jgi:hypothetical protein
MAERDETGGFSVLDGAALVAGAAVAAVHIRRPIDLDESFGIGWVLLWLTFFWIALTAAGPFIYLVRRYLRILKGYPQIGDRLWAMLGLPWLMTALFQPGGRFGENPYREVFSLVLGLGILAVSSLSLWVVWSRWVMVSPRDASETFSKPWTNRIGLVLAVAWPVQCGVGMVVID